MPSKVAILLPSLKFGGAERVCMTLARELKRVGIAVDFVLMKMEGELLHLALDEFSVHDLKCDRTYKLPYQLQSYIRRFGPDVLISNFWKLHFMFMHCTYLLPEIEIDIVGTLPAVEECSESGMALRAECEYILPGGNAHRRCIRQR